MKKRIFAVAALLAVLVSATSSTAISQVSVGIGINFGPPPSRYEAVVAPPFAHAVWIRGHWGWDPYADRYVWERGYWVHERPSYVWVDGDWHHGPRGWGWSRGYWRHDDRGWGHGHDRHEKGHGKHGRDH